MTLVSAPPETKAAAAPSGKVRKRRWRRAVSPLLILALWEIGARAGLIPEDKLPAPSVVLRTGWRLAADGTLGHHLFDSLTRAAVGLLIGGTLALVLGSLAGLLRLGDDAIDP